MTTQNGSNELRVVDADIQRDLEEFGIVDIGVTIFIPGKEIEKDETGATGSASDGASTGTKIGFGDGKVTATTILIPIQNAMAVPAADLNDKRKEAIKKKAEQSKEQKEREGIGE